ncbi:MAG: STAS domain-containing protein [Acidimicrobiia bacterium]
MHETAHSDGPAAPAGSLDATGLRLEVVEGPDGAIVAVRGELDLASAPELQRELVARLEGGVSRLTLDLGDVSFLDSSGLGALYRTQQAAEKRGAHLRLVAVPDHVLRVLEVTAMASLFDIDSGGS